MRNLLLTFTLLLPQMANANVDSCLATKYEAYSLAKSEYQKKLTQLIISQHPEFESIANTYMNDQLIRIEKNLISFHYLQKNPSESLKTAKTINRWVSTNEEEEQKIATTSQRYAELLNDINKSRTRPENKMGGELREVMRNEIMLLPDFSNITSDLSRKMKALNDTHCP